MALKKRSVGGTGVGFFGEARASHPQKTAEEMLGTAECGRRTTASFLGMRAGSLHSYCASDQNNGVNRESITKILESSNGGAFELPCSIVFFRMPAALKNAASNRPSRYPSGYTRDIAVSNHANDYRRR